MRKYGERVRRVIRVRMNGRERERERERELGLVELKVKPG
jgi:hypothetical protein